MRQLSNDSGHSDLICLISIVREFGIFLNDPVTSAATSSGVTRREFERNGIIKIKPLSRHISSVSRDLDNMLD